MMGPWMLTLAQGCAAAPAVLDAEPSWDQGGVVHSAPSFPSFRVALFSCLGAMLASTGVRQSCHRGVGTGSVASLLLGSAGAALGTCRARLQMVTHQLSFGTLFPMQGFGRADHAVTTEKLKAEYPDYEITWADEGY